MAVPTYWTAAEVLALPEDGNRYEVVRGELLVSPSPRALHQLVLGRLYAALSSYLERVGVGQVFFAPADITFGPDTLVQPDLFVVPLAEARSLEWAAMRRLLLAVEILSPSTSRADRFTKRRLYQEVGVPVYWLVNPEAGEVEVWTPGDPYPKIEREVLAWEPRGALVPFTVRVADLFREI